MCIFTAAVRRVSNTRIFVTELEDGRQFTVYQNAVAFAATGKRVAMILPFPNAEGKVTAQSEIMWNMEKYTDFFADCEELFTIRSRGGPSSKSAKSAPLPIHSCGAYQYSVVPTLSAFAGLKYEHFGLDEPAPGFLANLRDYYGNNYGYLVCIYTKEGEIPPVAFMHPMLPRSRLFVPTMHSHHGEMRETTGDWDHDIYVINNASAIGLEYSCVNGNVRLPVVNLTVADKAIIRGIAMAKSYGKYSRKLRCELLPPGFPTRTKLESGLHTTRIHINGQQPNGDLTFISALSLGRCCEEGACTRAITGDDHVTQPMWVCATCFPPIEESKPNNCVLCKPCGEKHAAMGHAANHRGRNAERCFCGSNLVVV